MPDIILNNEQKDAIEYGEGPLLIIAGAGSGKTTVITERIKHLILKKGVVPNEILALTFTEKAASEMEERIDKIMPYGYTQMWISTFHSFCDQILREEAINIGLSPNYRLMTEAESILFLKKKLFKLDLDYYRPLGNPTKFLEALLQHFSRLHDEDITPGEYLKYSQAISNFNPPAGGPISNEKDKSVKKLEMKKTRELAYAFKTYEDLKTTEGFFDFSNLISHALKLLRTRQNILKKYQNQFKYILVDEFQDTNYAQNELAILLCGAKKNITVVADDDQTIYRWRGAALSNVIQFRNNFANAKIITLTKNYRSSQTILDNAYQLIQHNNPNRLEMLENINKKLTSERKVKGLPIEVIQTTRVDEEAEFIAKKISALTADKYKYSDIAILVRANNHAQPITQVFSRFKIPYQFLGPGYLFHREEIKDLIAYLKILYDIGDSVSLFRVLEMEIFNISMRDVSFLLSFARRQNLTLFEALPKIDEVVVTQEAKEKIKKIYDMVIRHLERIKKDSAGQILFYFLSDSGLLTKFLDYSSEKDEQVSQNIAKFFDKIKTFESASGNSSIYSVVDWIDLMMEIGDSPLASDLDLREQNAVKFLTVHSSKGLEFPVVFMVNLVVDRFPTRERKEKIPIPSNLIKEILPEGDYHAQEERRLFYVGMTRARDLLIFTASKFYAEAKKEKKLSPFIHEALPDFKTQIVDGKVTQLSLIDVARDYSEKIESQDDSNIKKFKVTNLSYSALSAFDICPLHFRARYILHLPSPFSAPLSFGSSIHATFKDFYELHIQGKTPKEADFLLLLRKNWVSEGYQEKSYEKKMFENGIKIIKNYYKNLFDPQKKPLSLEMPFSFNLDPNLKISGKIDRIDSLDGKGIEIIDYKTGQSEGLSKNAYNLQLGLYALAATKVQNEVLRRKPEDITVTLFYLEDGKKISNKVTQEDLVGIDKKIREKVKEIESSNFKCSKSVLCLNCEYKMLCNINA